MYQFICSILSYFTEYEVAFDKFAANGVLGYKDIKKFFDSVGHVPSQKEIDGAIEIVTKSKLCQEYLSVFLSSFAHDGQILWDQLNLTSSLQVNIELYFLSVFLSFSVCQRSQSD